MQLAKLHRASRGNRFIQSSLDGTKFRRNRRFVGAMHAGISCVDFAVLINQLGDPSHETFHGIFLLFFCIIHQRFDKYRPGREMGLFWREIQTHSTMMGIFMPIRGNDISSVLR